MNNIKKGIKYFILFSIAASLLSGCKNIANPEYTMTVELSQGIEGTPVAGTYVHNEFDKVEYDYKSTDENVQIELLVNGAKKPISGTFTIYNNFTVAVHRIDIRDTWEFSYLKEDGTTEKMDIVFSGDTIFSGTFSDSRGYLGVWTVANDDFTMTYSDWSDYVFTGNISTMVGTYKGKGLSGSWKASRKQ